jgi:non-ribosomal peptide synthetase component F
MALGVDAEPMSIPVTLEALWSSSQLNPRQIAYNEAIAIRKRGPLDVSALREALNSLMSRHDGWHSIIQRVGGDAVLVPQPPSRDALAITDLSALDPEAAERHVVRVIAEMASVPYDLSRGPLVRPRLVAMPGDEHRLYLALHHMTFDGVSLYRTIVPELIALYDAYRAGSPDPLGPQQARYSDYARWEQEWISTPRAARRLAYWRTRLDPPPPPPSLPLDEARPATPEHRGGTLPVHLSAMTTGALHRIALEAGSSAFQVFGAIWAALLHRFSGQTDVIFGAPADLRQRSEFESVVGYCLSPVILRVDLSDDPEILELVGRVRNELLDGLDHLVPFGRIVEAVGGVDHGANPIYQSLLTLEPAVAFSDPDWSMLLMDSALGDAIGAAKLDLELQLDAGTDQTTTGRLIYDRDLFSRDTAERIAEAWRRVAEAVAADPHQRISELAICGPTDHARLTEFNATAVDQPDEGIAEMIAARAASQPDRPALSAAGTTVSYSELQAAATATAGRLRAADLTPGGAVAVCLAPTAELVSTALGVLIAGGMPVLLNPADSGLPLRDRVTAAGCRLSITSASTSVDPITVELHPASVGAGGSSVASGLTDPGVRAIVSTLTSQIGFAPADSVLSVPATLYSSSCTELWPALVSGARLVLAPEEIGQDGAAVRALILAEGVSFLHATPSLWQGLIDTGLGTVRGLRVLSGGAPLSRQLADELIARFRVVWNGCCPAVAGGYVTLGQVLSAKPVTVGRPIDNHRAHVIDPQGRPQPIGFVGELLITGAVVDAVQSSRDRWVVEPGGPGTAWRTGLRARWLANGHLVISDQPKQPV